MTKKALTRDELTQLTEGLKRLARNLWWTWDQGAQEIFQNLSPRGWQNLYHNAVAVLPEGFEQGLRPRVQHHGFSEKRLIGRDRFDLDLQGPAPCAPQHGPPALLQPIAFFTA